MPNRIPFWCAVLCLAASAAGAASVERADELYLSGDLEAARAELQEVLAGDGDEPGRPSALALLGRIEVDRRNWRGALDAWSELTDRYALSSQAAAISAAIRPLQALVDCGCCESPVQRQLPSGEAAAARAPAPAVSVPVPAPPPAPAPAPIQAPAPAITPAAGLLLVGGWGAEYEASQEATRDLTEFLEASGVGVRQASTEVPAVRGREAVLAFLLAEARRVGADGVIFVTTRFNFREFIQIERYDANGGELWSDKLSGGTALKERRDRGKPSWNLVERMKKRLAELLGIEDPAAD